MSTHQYTQVPEIKQVSTIGTHSGTFHADEAMAIAILKFLPEFAEANIFRSRDTEFLDTLDILVDVGSKYDVDTLRFDHHQREFTERFSDKHQIRLSSAGLIYKHYGMAALKQLLTDNGLSTHFSHLPAPLLKKTQDIFNKNPQNFDLVFEKIYKNLILGMDGIDNGVPQYPANVEPSYRTTGTLDARVSRLNPSWVQEAYYSDEDKAAIKKAQAEHVENLDKFKIAISICSEEFLSQVENIIFSWLSGRELIQDALNDRFNQHTSGRIVIANSFFPWKSHFFDALEKDSTLSNILFFAYPSGSSWRYLAVPQTASSFEIKVDFPPEWKGLRDAELERVSGVENSSPSFIHHTGFTGGAANKEALIQLLEKAIEYHDNQ
jgi:uncharacterized UPF0160 family protein